MRYADPLYPLANFTISEELAKDARRSLHTILLSHNDPDFPKALYILRFSARHRELRRRFIAHDEVIAALMRALERITESRSGDLYPLVVGSLCSLIDDGTCDQHRLMYMLILYRCPTKQRY